jgi:hypothetical protein
MAIDKLFFSTTQHWWTDDTVELLDSSNLTTAIQSTVLKNYHTSIEDITTKNLQQVCQHANWISLVDIGYDFFSNDSKNDDSFSAGRLLNELSKVRDKVENFDFVDAFNLTRFNKLLDNRPVDSKVLWTVGCSFTAGDGVEWGERYGHILSTMMGIPEISLSQSGSSIPWAADQILRSDIQPGDMVVWGLTSMERFEYMAGSELTAQTLANGVRLNIPIAEPLEYFGSNLHLMRSIRSILQVINFCKLIGAELYIANLLELTYIPVVLSNFDRFIDLTKDCQIKDVVEFIDYGKDNLHPGPLQHNIYATQIYDFIQAKTY